MNKVSKKSLAVLCDWCGKEFNVSEEIKAQNEKHYCCVGCENAAAFNNCTLEWEKVSEAQEAEYKYLDQEDIFKQLTNSFPNQVFQVIFQLPAIHCSSCLHTLERLPQKLKGVKSARVNFIKKEITIKFVKAEVTLATIAATLKANGYPPEVLRFDQKEKSRILSDRFLLARLGVTGFATGNIMILSFPEYLGMKEVVDGLSPTLFTALNIAFSLPIIFFGAWPYFYNALKALQKKETDIYVPLAIGISAILFRSFYEVITQTGPGYWDSFSGLIFFLLAGRYVQTRTYEHLSFNKKLEDWFPLHTYRLQENGWQIAAITKLNVGDIIRIKPSEIIPTDGILLSEKATIDYSFLSGESAPELLKKHETILAGGRVLGQSAEIQVEKPTSLSTFTSLWNREEFSKDKFDSQTLLSHLFSKYFTVATIFLALLTGLFWWVVSPDQILNTVSAVLIVACPCALSLGMPFALRAGMLRASKLGFFVRQPEVLQRLSGIKHIVFDKTGTLVNSGVIAFEGKALNTEELSVLSAMVNASHHPVSKAIRAYLESNHTNLSEIEIQVKEFQGLGLKAEYIGKTYLLGSSKLFSRLNPTHFENSGAFFGTEDQILGTFSSKQELKPGVGESLALLKTQGYKLTLLSGDPNNCPSVLAPFFEPENIFMNQSPESKMKVLEEIRCSGQNNRVAMVGDGLNDAGAFQVSDVAIAITDTEYAFTPASDAILRGSAFQMLPSIFSYSHKILLAVKLAFVLSMFYNALALTFAVSGWLTPVFAAILMPISSLSVVGLASLLSSIWAPKTV